LAGPGEFEYVVEASSLCSRQHIICDDFDILDLTALLKNCRLHVGTSSAPMHIAVSQDIPTFTVYSERTNPVNWTPVNSDKHSYIQGNFLTLSAFQVFEKIQQFLKEKIK